MRLVFKWLTITKWQYLHRNKAPLYVNSLSIKYKVVYVTSPSSYYYYFRIPVLPISHRDDQDNPFRSFDNCAFSRDVEEGIANVNGHIFSSTHPCLHYIYSFLLSTYLFMHIIDHTDLARWMSQLPKSQDRFPKIR